MNLTIEHKLICDDTHSFTCIPNPEDSITIYNKDWKQGLMDMIKALDEHELIRTEINNNNEITS